MLHLKTIITIAAVLAMNICVASVACADSVDMRVGRYMTSVSKPSLAQRDLLSQTIQVRFPLSVQTVGDALHYLLRYSGYSLVDASHQNAALKILLKKPLPWVDREFQSLSLKDALITLAGPAFTLSEDVLNREVNFPLKPEFSKKLKSL